MDSKRIKRLRERLGLTQREFGDLVDKDFITVSRWERGTQKPSVLALERLKEIEGE